MMNMRAYTLCLLATLLGLVSTGVAQDRVYPEQGVAASGKIVTITPNEVTINVRGAEQKFSVDDIRKLSFDGEPNGLDRAREQALMGQYEQAVEEVKKLSTNGIENPLIVQDIEFYRWYCEGKLGLAGSGDKNAAIKGLYALAGQNRNTHHLYPLSEILGELSLAIGQPDKAVTFFTMLLNAPSADTKASGIYRLGEVELSQGKPAEAKVRFEQLAAAPSNSQKLAWRSAKTWRATVSRLWRA